MALFETYIFDLDGTLLYTLEDLTNSTNHAMRKFGFPEHTKEDVRLMVGNGIRKLIERAIPEGLNNTKYEDVYLEFVSYYLEHAIDTTRPYPGIIEMLKKLKERGKHLAVVSNKYCKATENLCRSFFADYISVAIGENSNIRKKPAPDTVLEAMNRLGADKATTVYVGDSEVDIETARNCGIPCISVLWGFRDKDFLIRNGGSIFVEKPEDIIYLTEN